MGSRKRADPSHEGSSAPDPPKTPLFRKPDEDSGLASRSASAVARRFADAGYSDIREGTPWTPEMVAPGGRYAALGGESPDDLRRLRTWPGERRHFHTAGMINLRGSSSHESSHESAIPSIYESAEIAGIVEAGRGAQDEWKTPEAELFY